MIDKTTVIDFGGLSHANFFVSNNKNDMDTEQKYQFWKYLCLNNIRMIKNKFKPDELIIACDSRSWRKEFFKFYKAHRVIGREKSSIDWDMFYAEIQKFLNELRENFPAYKIIEAKGAEADDIIGIIVNGLRSIRKEIDIISRDHDFRQLIGNNVRLWDPIAKKFVQCDSPKEYLLMHILGGDPGDGIPNVKSDGDTFIDENKRQKPFGKKTIEKALIYGLDKYLIENNLEENYIRNRKLVELSPEMIPKSIQRNVYIQYKKCNNDAKNSFLTIQKYLAKNKFRSLIDRVDNFI